MYFLPDWVHKRLNLLTIKILYLWLSVYCYKMLVMFSQGFRKIATTVVTMTPEEYYNLAREKDPYIGTLAGTGAGAIAGGLKGAKGKKSKSALVGAGLGAAGGAITGHQASKLIKHYQSKKVRRLAEQLKLRSAPRRSAYEE